MILLVILVGLYLVMSVGYYKMVRKAMLADSGLTPGFTIESITVGMVSVVWPAALVYLLLKEAIE